MLARLSPQQALWLTLDQREALYGGAAGGGKSFALLMAALQYVHVPGYAALILRRSFPQLTQPGMIVPASKEWLAGSDAKWSERDMSWTFPAGGVLKFGHVNDENAALNYQGGAYQFCVAKDTPVVMANGTTKAIQDVEIGDVVQTLEGPRPVTGTHALGRKPVWRVTTPAGESVVSSTHRLLTADGWASPEALIPTRSRAWHGTPSSSPASFQVSGLPFEYSPSDRTLALAGATRTLAGSHHRVTVSSSEDRGSGCGASDGERPAAPQLRSLSVRLVLYAPTLRSEGRMTSGGTPRDAQARAHDESEQRGSPIGCPSCRGSRDERSRSDAVDARGGTQRRDGAGRRSLRYFPGGLASTPSRDPIDRFEYVHPYTMEPRAATEPVALSWVSMAPAGEAEVFDLTVAGASHYVLSSGVVAANCGFDELTQFTETMYTYIAFSRQRRALYGHIAGVPIRVRSTTNPGGPGHTWVKNRFPLKTGDTPDTHDGRIFIPAKVRDNLGLDADDYEKSLMHLPDVLRAQLMDGDWGAFEGAAYPLFSDDTHVVAAFDPPAGYERFESMDFGTTNPTAWLAWTVDYDGNLIAFDELYEPGLPSVTAPKVLERRTVWRSDVCYGDPSIWASAGVTNRWGEPASVGTEFQEFGVHVVKANNDTVAGYVRLAELVKPDPERLFPAWHPKAGRPGAPRLYVTRSCPNLIEQMQAAVLAGETEPHPGEQVSRRWEGPHGHSHASARYGVLSRPDPSKVPEAVPADPRAALLARVERERNEDPRARIAI